jgi:hypothetical protein
MRTPSSLSDHLREFLRVKKIATLPELKQALGTTVNITVFRKLKELSYRSSYSHRGRYYTLDEIPQFDPQGSVLIGCHAGPSTHFTYREGNSLKTLEN